MNLRQQILLWLAGCVTCWPCSTGRYFWKSEHTESGTPVRHGKPIFSGFPHRQFQGDNAINGVHMACPIPIWTGPVGYRRRTCPGSPSGGQSPPLSQINCEKRKAVYCTCDDSVSRPHGCIQRRSSGTGSPTAQTTSIPIRRARQRPPFHILFYAQSA